MAGVGRRKTGTQRNLEGIEREILGFGKPGWRLGKKRAQLVILVSFFGRPTAPFCGIEWLISLVANLSFYSGARQGC